MPIAAAIPLLALIALAIAAAAYAALALAKIHATTRAYPTLAQRTDAPPPAGRWPSLLIVVPAHNEADVIATIARAILNADYPNLHAVFALDRCTDDTHAILRATIDQHPDRNRADRITIHPIDHCPDDWAGKVHAIHHAVQHHPLATPNTQHTAELILFLDADCDLHPATLRAAVSLLNEFDLDLLSVLSSLIAEHWYERIVQPVAAFELVRQYPPRRVNADFNLPRDPATGRLTGQRRSWPFANGQCILVRAAPYHDLGGHHAVRNEILEDIAIAKKFSRAGWRIGVFASAGPLACRMYRSWNAFQRGWKRIYTEAAKRRPGRLASNHNAVLITKVLFPLAAPACLAAAAIAAILRDPPLAWTAAIAAIAAATLTHALAATEFALQRRPAPTPWSLIRGGLHTATLLRHARRELLAGDATTWAGKRYHRPVNLDQSPRQPRPARSIDPDNHARQTHAPERSP